MAHELNQHRKREFYVRAFGVYESAVLKCSYLTPHLSGIIETYWRTYAEREKKAILARSISEWERENVEPDIIERGKRNLELELEGAISQDTFKEHFPQWSIDTMAAYVERALPEAFEIALELLLEEARVCACHDDTPEQDDFDNIVFTFKEYLKIRMGMRRHSKPRKRTPALTLEAARLFSKHHQRIRAAAKDYTKHKGSAVWSKHVALEDKKRPGFPKIPSDLILQIPLKSPREIALEWTAQEMNQRHENLGATAHTVRNLLKAEAKADTQQE